MRNLSEHFGATILKERQTKALLLILILLLGSSNANAQNILTVCENEDDGELCTDGMFEGICGWVSNNNCIEDDNGNVECEYIDCLPRNCRQDQKLGDPCKLGELDGVCEHRCNRVECNYPPSGSGWCLLPAPVGQENSLSDDGCSARGGEPVGPLHILALLGVLGLRRPRKSLVPLQETRKP